jgi:hypothetical protein
MRVEIRSQILDDSIGEAKAVQDVADEADYSIGGDFCNRLALDPLCKLVNGHQHMGKTSWHYSQRPNHVQAPTSERQERWYGDEVVHRDVSMPAEELAIGTPMNEIFSVSQSCWLVIPRPECFPD